jgi:glycine/D-amino acid oxidase-like deaminating enzyme
VKTDFLIVGQGLAGSLLAWHLLDAGKRVLVVDRDEVETSSKVAAGLVTPLAGGRFHLPDGLEERLDFARSFYWKHEELSGEVFFHHRRIARLFRDALEAEVWKNRLDRVSGRYARFHGPLQVDAERISAPWGGFEMREGGWLDVPAFLEYTRRVLLERVSYAIGQVDSREILTSASSIRWKNVEASHVVFCEGWRGGQNRFFDWVPVRPTPGDILDLEIAGLGDETRILNKGGWLIPLGDGRFRAGSTYRPVGATAEVSAIGRDEVLAKIALMTPLTPAVTGHRCAVRPTIRRSQVFMGRHPSEPRIAFFNGLGSKGVLNGPWHASRLADHLLSGAPLPAATDLLLHFH